MSIFRFINSVDTLLTTHTMLYSTKGNAPLSWLQLFTFDVNIGRWKYPRLYLRTSYHFLLHPHSQLIAHSKKNLSKHICITPSNENCAIFHYRHPPFALGRYFMRDYFCTTRIILYSTKRKIRPHLRATL